ncbi:unnamed protein product [marine sediment metagenome]|uniref:Uncharacterized protein n=1 Tax=marine sediment metagenome TaxID=412755 RepID=X1DT77_9ZZZZ
MYKVKMKGIKKPYRLTNREYRALKLHPARKRKITSARKY